MKVQKSSILFAFWLVAAGANVFAQAPANVSQVLMWSTLTDKPIDTTRGLISKPLFSVYTTATPVDAGSSAFVPTITNAQNYKVAHSSALSSALSSNIAVALSVIPLSSPTSGVILKKDPVSGAELPASSSLGPIFTQRAETVGKGKVYLGFTHQDYHFTSINGEKLNGLTVLYGGGDASGIRLGSTATATAPATFNMGLDVRLSQDLAFLTFGVTNRFDVSVGLPTVHSAVSARSYNGVVYSGSGDEFKSDGTQCWCINTLTPGVKTLTMPQIGQASLSKSGFGDMLLRFKQEVFENQRASMAVGADVRLPTGDADNYLGIGTTAVKPFFALSLYSKRLANGLIFAPHFDAGWQFSGKSVLGGTLNGAQTNAALQGGATIPVTGAPLVSTKGFVPDVFSWSAGTEVAVGRKNTVVLDMFGNTIGLIHGAQLLRTQNIAAPAPTDLQGAIPMSKGLTDGGRGSYNQYSGSFGYKVKVMGNLVATAQALVRFDNNGLTARVVPLFGLGYSF